MTISLGSTARLLALGIIFHLVYIGTVFDCYFTSPVVHGMRQHRLSQAQAKRLVLIVGDGLRADFVFSANATDLVPGAPERVAPYLRDIVENRGAYGVSHTRVPTESRPGHVAIIAGMYEDVSAVTKGWKTNPVDFDSVFNQSSHTFSFGSPDILPMFVQGATPGRVEGWSYHGDHEDFTKDATELDIWVLDQLKSLFRNATTNVTLDAQLRAPQVVFFLHLLGLDTTGHSYRPHSKEYVNNILVVDDIVRETEQLFSEFYGDQETSYIFTADHGMSKIGNHGDGDPDNTRTPLIAWGAGIRKPIRDQTFSRVTDDYSTPWGLSHVLRRDVEQADVAALMSALLGAFWPVNSVGILPDVDPTKDGYLSMPGGEREVAEAGVVNAKVMLEHYRVKHELKKIHAILYKPYQLLDHPSSVSEYPGSRHLSYIESLIATGRFQEARHHSHELIKTTLGGIRYLETYDRTLIRVIVTFAYTGWIAFSAAFILVPSQPPEVSSLWIRVFFNTATVASCLFFAIQRLPWTLHVYILFPLYFWKEVAIRVSVASSVVRNHKLGTRWIAKTALGLVLAVAALQSMVFGYSNRAVWSVGFVTIGLGWPLTSWPEGRRKFFEPWAASCLLTAVFPLLRVDPSESLGTIMAGGMCMLIAGELAVREVSEMESSHAYVRATFQLLLTALSMLVTAASVWSLQAKQGLPRLNQAAGWVIFLLSALLPFFLRAPRTAEGRLLTYFLSFCPCFVLLSIRAEGLFYLSYCTTLYLWTRVEEAVRSETSKRPTQTTDRGEYEPRWNPRRLSLDDIRVALFFLFFVQVGFFGTGNAHSCQFRSFYLEPVYRLVPVFNPFLMATLLLFKILSPFVFLSAAFATLNERLGMPPFALFLVALSLTDVMTMTFFFNVTDTGSWLQIGQSISHFCITSLLLVFSAGITSSGEALMRGTVLRRSKGSQPELRPRRVDDISSTHSGHSLSNNDITKRNTAP
ncbi:alkaline phosphatase-like protein [Lactarius quietus]|nr:alkaline phosphatase-like protein [Lactarius quietus]